MGYTNYWHFNSVPKGKAKQVEELYQNAIKECSKIIKYWQKTCEDYERLSGFTAHTAIGAYGGIEVNGKQECAHEFFNLTEHFNQNRQGNFCKTNRHPYDIIVKACLVVLKDNLGDIVEISSDGEIEDWVEGLDLADKVLGRTMKGSLRV